GGTFLPVREVLAETGSNFSPLRRVAEDFDQAEDSRDPPEEPKASALRLAGRVGVVPEVGMLSVARDLVLHDGRPGGVERAFADLLGELVKRIVHDEIAWAGLAEHHAPSSARSRPLFRHVRCQRPEREICEETAIRGVAPPDLGWRRQVVRVEFAPYPC